MLIANIGIKIQKNRNINSGLVNKNRLNKNYIKLKIISMLF